MMNCNPEVKGCSYVNLCSVSDGTRGATPLQRDTPRTEAAIESDVAVDSIRVSCAWSAGPGR